MAEMNKRQLDTLVAEKVMGWTNITKDAYVSTGRAHCGAHPDKKGGFDGFGRKIIPHYSTNIKDVWEVVEVLIHWWPEFSLLKFVDTMDKDLWECCLSSKKRVFAEAETPSLAICLAALEAKGILWKDRDRLLNG